MDENRLEKTAKVMQKLIDDEMADPIKDGSNIANASEHLALMEKTITEREKLAVEKERIEADRCEAELRLQVEREKIEAEKKAAELKAKTEREKLALERKRLEIETPKPPTLFQKILDFGKSWGGPIAAGLTLTGVIIHERTNRKNLKDGFTYEETGSVKSTSFKKWIK